MLPTSSTGPDMPFPIIVADTLETWSMKEMEKATLFVSSLNNAFVLTKSTNGSALVGASLVTREGQSNT